MGEFVAPPFDLATIQTLLAIPLSRYAAPHFSSYCLSVLPKALPPLPPSEDHQATPSYRVSTELQWGELRQEPFGTYARVAGLY